jgi:hypothetical protein
VEQQKMIFELYLQACGPRQRSLRATLLKKKKVLESVMRGRSALNRKLLEKMKLKITSHHGCCESYFTC